MAEIDSRGRADADAAAKASAARAAAAKSAANSPSSGGLIVRDDRADEARHAAEASRIAAEGEGRAAAERDRVTTMRAQQDCEAAENAKKREERRIQALIKCHGSLEKAKTAKATCALPGPRGHDLGCNPTRQSQVPPLDAFIRSPHMRPAGTRLR
ncbi:hypothetical protein [Sphingomonas bacterium]|uniref:hypothetical protein n=1 Tax=Sphingomonas bacterium TaxID=1895847 RepID=UPI00261DF519|nr:hypothetical protein [Sphingomonas bacterium]